MAGWRHVTSSGTDREVMMRTGTFRGFEVTLHEPGIAVITFTNNPG